MPQVALIHDFLLDLRGAERVFAAICDAYPTADVFTAVYDEKGTEGRFAARSPQASYLQRLRPTVAHLPPAAALLPGGDRVAGPARLRHRHLVLERLGARRARRSRRRARLLLPQPVPLRVVRARGDARGAQPADAARAAGAALALAPVGLDRGPARRRLRGELGDHRRPRPALLRARVDGPASAGGALALLARPGRRALPGAGRADGAQAHRRGDPGLQRARAPAGRRRRRTRVAAAAPTCRPDGAVDRADSRTPRSRICYVARRRSSSRPRRNSGSPRSSRWPPGGP